MIGSLLLVSAPTYVVVLLLALGAWRVLRQRPFWSWAVPTSLVAGTVIGSVFYFGSVAESGAFSMVSTWVLMVAAAPLLLFAPLLGDTDPVVLAPLLPPILAFGWAVLVLGLLCVVRLISRGRRSRADPEV